MVFFFIFVNIIRLGYIQKYFADQPRDHFSLSFLKQIIFHQKIIYKFVK